MAIFANGPGNPQTTAVTTSATLVFDTDASGVPTGAALPDVTIENIGANACFIGGASISSTAQGVRLAPGAQLTIRGYLGNQSSTTGDVYAICASSALTTVIAGLATLAPVA